MDVLKFESNIFEIIYIDFSILDVGTSGIDELSHFVPWNSNPHGLECSTQLLCIDVPCSVVVDLQGKQLSVDYKY